MDERKPMITETNLLHVIHDLDNFRDRRVIVNNFFKSAKLYASQQTSILGKRVSTSEIVNLLLSEPRIIEHQVFIEDSNLLKLIKKGKNSKLSSGKRVDEIQQRWGSQGTKSHKNRGGRRGGRR